MDDSRKCDESYGMSGKGGTKKVEEPGQIGSWLKIWNPVRTAAEMKSAIPQERGGEREEEEEVSQFHNSLLGLDSSTDHTRRAEIGMDKNFTLRFYKSNFLLLLAVTVLAVTCTIAWSICSAGRRQSCT